MFGLLGFHNICVKRFASFRQGNFVRNCYQKKLKWRFRTYARLWPAHALGAVIGGGVYCIYFCYFSRKSGFVVREKINFFPTVLLLEPQKLNFCKNMHFSFFEIVFSKLNFSLLLEVIAIITTGKIRLINGSIWWQLDSPSDPPNAQLIGLFIVDFLILIGKMMFFV